MPRISPVDHEIADAETRASLDAIKAKIGMVPNLYATLAQSPAVLNGYLGLSNALSTGRLTPRQREIVALATAQINECHYCLSAHTLLGKNAGLTADEVRAARLGRSMDMQDHAVASLAVGLNKHRGAVSNQDLMDARAAGLDDGQIIEVIAYVALNTLTNFTNNLAQTDVDFPSVEVLLAA